MEVIINKNVNAAYIQGKEILIYDVQSAMDLLATISYEYGCSAMIVNKNLIAEAFFDLRTCIAGEIVQKFVNYKMILIIIGDFSKYDSKALQDYIYECNKGKDILFVRDEEEADKQLKRISHYIL
jgi:hypothetical protein